MRLFLLPLIVGALAASPVYAQLTLDAPLDQVMLEYVVDSGIQADVPGDPSTVFATTIEIEGASWMRIYFGDAELAPGSFIRMTSLFDAEVQVLDAGGLAQWSNSSAYFNGDAVHVELVAAAGTKANRLRIARLAHATVIPPAAAGGPGDCGICGGVDDRVPSSEEWTARLFPAGCTASVIGLGRPLHRRQHGRAVQRAPLDRGLSAGQPACRRSVSDYRLRVRQQRTRRRLGRAQGRQQQPPPDAL
jgi:hypothetical protein